MIYINGTPVHTTLFPDNTSQVWKVKTLDLPDTNFVNIRWEFSHEGEFMQLAQLKTLLDVKGFNAALTLKYLPYGRQDKMVANDATFALRTFAELLNTLNFKEIRIMDPHSMIAVELIRNSQAVFPTEQLGETMAKVDSDMICYPDKGALSKYTQIYDVGDYIYGEKVRDQLTGNILDYRIISDGNEITNFKGKNILIVDDICDGGATFINLAKKLRLCGVGDINLFVTHGIFSKGLKTLKESGIKRIFTQDGEASEIQGRLAYKRL